MDIQHRDKTDDSMEDLTPVEWLTEVSAADSEDTEDAESEEDDTIGANVSLDSNKGNQNHQIEDAPTVVLL